MDGHNIEVWRRTEPYFQSDFLSRAHIPEWLGEVSKKKILDVGCGEGYVARMLATRGAHVFGFDREPRMIDLAQQMQRERPQNIEYKVAKLDNVRQEYPENNFDIVLLSGIPPCLDESQLYSSSETLAQMLLPGGTLLLTTNHTDSYFQRAQSNWIVFTSDPDPSLPTQQGSVNFYTPDGGFAFSGPCYFHTPEQLKNALMAAGLEHISEYAPLASDEDRTHFPIMWIDEARIPFHIAVKAIKP